MIVKMDKMSMPSSREVAQRLYDKNVDLENRRRKSAKARVPSDPNAWQQMRENYEAIILEDHTFSEQHNIEYALWQLHYKRIEEFRAHCSAALASMGSTTSQGGKGPSRPDRNMKIRAQFKTFLSEATGFYHDLVLKVRAKYGLPLGHFSEEPENHMVMDKGGKKSSEVKKGLVSCHRCLIYLGDLARYKGLYGEGDPKIRDYAAASSYYRQAASLLPSSGNPHHQLAILASYSGDELGAVYCYFRSLAVDCPFSTARDNLIVVFEKNRLTYSQMHGDAKASTSKESNMWFAVKGRGKDGAESLHKDTNGDVVSAGDVPSSIHDMYKVFCVQFVRLNGLFFTRTSLETFAEVLSTVSNGLRELLASGTDEELNFGEGVLENGLAIVRLISILIFTVHNVNKLTEGQTYAEILQRNVLLQNAFTSVFEFMGHILNRCIQLHDPSSSYLLPGILVFLEWLACCSEAAVGSDADEKQACVRSVFWTHFVSLLNKLLSNGLVAIDLEDETCFTNMSRYDEGETDNRLALWEDFELRGFLPLLPAQTILDFSRKHSFSSDGSKDKKARVRRIIAAGKALAAMFRVGQKTMYFDSEVKKFIINEETPKRVSFNNDPLSMPRTIGLIQETPAVKAIDSGVSQHKQLYVEGEQDDDDDEVIVFKPSISEKQLDAIDHSWIDSNNIESGKNSSAGDLQFFGGSATIPPADQNHNTVFSSTLQPPVTLANIIPPHLPQCSSTWFGQQKETLANGLKCLNILESVQPGIPQIEKEMATSSSAPFPLAIQHTVNPNNMYGQARAPDVVVPSKIDSAVFSGVNDDSFFMKTSSAFPPTSKNPVSRPVRHNGPPPGFNLQPLKQANEPVSGLGLTSESPPIDDYSWLDGYQGSGFNKSINHVSNSKSEFISKSNGLSGTIGFPFPGKQVPALQFQGEKQNRWQDDQAPEHLQLQYQQRLQQQPLLGRGNQQFTPFLQQYQGSSIQTGHHFV